MDSSTTTDLHQLNICQSVGNFRRKESNKDCMDFVNTVFCYCVDLTIGLGVIARHFYTLGSLCMNQMHLSHLTLKYLHPVSYLEISEGSLVPN